MTGAPHPPVVLLGGRSEIGLEVVSALLATGPRPVVLASRPGPDPTAVETAVRAAGATSVRTVPFDADDLGQHAAVLDDALAGLHRPVVVVAFGVLGDQSRAERDPGHAAAIAHTDYVAHVSVLTALRVLTEHSGATVVVFSSVAGTRVRRANYVYGSAKAGLDGFVTGMQDSLHGSPLRILLVRPGFVVGRMTEGMTAAPLATTPAAVAADVVAALAAGRSTLWVPRRLRWVALAFAILPRSVWRRLPR